VDAVIEEKKRCTPPWRNRERDLTIITLHDGPKEMTFGEIAIQLKRLNHEWVGKDGELLTYAAVKQAYNEGKKKRAKELPPRN
jgi:hypothetical protein